MGFQTKVTPGQASVLYRRAGQAEGVLVTSGTVRFERFSAADVEARERRRAEAAERRRAAGVADGRALVREGARRPAELLDLPPGIAAIEVVVGVGGDGAAPVVVERFTLEPEPGRGLTSRAITASRPGVWIAEAVDRLSQPVGADGVPLGRPGTPVDPDDVAYGQRGPVEPRRHRRDDARLAEVADAWRAAKEARRPTGAAVAEALGTNSDNARKLIQRAGEAGLIPPAARRR